MTYKNLITNFKYSHQPYVFQNKLLFCASNSISKIEYSPLSNTDNYSYSNDILWQLFISDLDEQLNLTNTKFIVTGYDIICSPILFKNNEKYYLSYLGGKFLNFGIKYNLLKSEFDLFNNKILNTQTITNNCFYGCNNNLFSLSGNRKDSYIKLIFKNSNEETIFSLNNDFSYIYRIVFLEKKNSKLLITGSSKYNNKQYKTILFDIYENKIIGELKVNNQSVYKSIFNDNFCIFSNKINEKSSFEERQLIITDNFKIE